MIDVVFSFIAVKPRGKFGEIDAPNLAQGADDRTNEPDPSLSHKIYQYFIFFDKRIQGSSTNS